METKEQKFYRCEICGNLVGLIESADLPLYCCGEEMTCLEGEKPSFEIKSENKDGILKVTFGGDNGSTPTLDWAYLQTTKGGQRKALDGGNVAEFALTKDENPKEIFAYSTVFGLIRSQI